MLMHEEGTTAAYMVSYNDLPPGSGKLLNVPDLMQNAMKDFLKSTSAKTLTSGEHQLGDIKGWEFTFAETRGRFPAARASISSSTGSTKWYTWDQPTQKTAKNRCTSWIPSACCASATALRSRNPEAGFG